MKIVHVETGCHLYGGALQVQYLMQGLAAHGHDNVLLCDARSPLAQAAAGVARVHAFEVSGDLDLRLAGRLWRLLQREQPDLLHLHSRRGADVMGGLAGRAAGVPVLLSRRVDNREPLALVPLKYALFDHVIAISRGIVAALEADGVAPERISCVPSAVDTDVYQPQRDRAWFEREFGIAPGEPVIGMVAQLIPRKGHRHLLAALPALWARHPHARVLLLGQGPLEAELGADIAARGWQGRVQLAGFRDDLPRLLPCLDVLAHPADREGLGVSLLQAAACGVPLVASAVGGIPEVVRENGFLVPPGDPAALAAALAGVLDDPAAAARMGERGRHWVHGQFSVAAMVAGNLAVYQRMVGGRTALPRPRLAAAD
jgi:glycosyltransferase involved in cell wall biosynthesis